MKKHILIAFVSLLILSCSSDDRIDNPFLADISINYEVNLNLPQYSDLEFPGESLILDVDGVGIKGIVLYNVNNSIYTAHELSDPNHAPSSCSAQGLNGVIVTCKCNDGNSYNIITGQPNTGDGQYALKAYNITRQGNSLFISN